MPIDSKTIYSSDRASQRSARYGIIYRGFGRRKVVRYSVWEEESDLTTLQQQLRGNS
jgi:hypothetical protein